MDHLLFYEITAVLLLAGCIGLLTGILKQPSIIAYILTGLIVGPLGYIHLRSPEVLNVLGEIGITLLLFMVGLELDISRVKQLGKVAIATGLGQIVFTTSIGFVLVKLLGYSLVESLYVAVALTFSSTIIVVKLLSEKRELQSLYGRIVVGFLIVQDFVALGLLVLLGATGGAEVPWMAGLPIWQVVVVTFAKVLALLLILAFVSRHVLPRLFRHLARSDELLLAFSLAWALGLAAFTSLPAVGLSLEIGGFLAGLALANSPVHLEIAGKVRSIRDFFIIIFFIVFGTQLVFTGITVVLVPAIILSLFVLIGNPAIVLTIMGWLGYKPRTSFFASVTVAQVSEFSFILMALGFRLGHIGGQAVALVTLVGIVTIASSSYLILYSKRIYRALQEPLKAFDFKRGSAEASLTGAVMKGHVILVGAHRLGAQLVSSLSHLGRQLVLVDFDPQVVDRYAASGATVFCGDIADSYTQEQLNLREAELVISTIPDLESNMELLAAIERECAGRAHRPKVVVAAQDEHESRRLYERKVDYVLSPHFVGGQHLARILEGAAGTKELHRFRAEHEKRLAELLS